jgi:hypothetical protein
MNVKDPSSRLRWRIQLEKYGYEIGYKPGAQNANADALSRINTLEKVKILQENHDSILGGHCGMNKTYEALKTLSVAQYEEEEYGRKCAKCQVNKTLRPNGKAPMEITTTATHPFERCALDTVGPLTESTSRNKYILSSRMT